MNLPRTFLAIAAMLTVPTAVSADNSVDMSVGFENQSADNGGMKGGTELPPYLQCVPYAREVSGIQIFGDAHSWWDQAEGRYQRGNRPIVGAVMAFQPYRNMTLGHVAAVSKIIDSRTVLISHSNWSPIDGRRGQIERNVRAVDVSPANDWSIVRVWYHPLQAVGTTAWPVHGFIYAGRNKGGAIRPIAETRLAQFTPPIAIPAKASKKFSQAFADMGAPTQAGPVKARAVPQPIRIAQVAQRPAPRRSDPVRDAIARYER